VYATPEDVRGVLSPDGEQDGYETAASFSNEALLAQIKKAEGRVNTYLAKRYHVPVDTAIYDTDGVIREWTATIAGWLATLTFSRGQDIGADDPIRLRFNDVMKMLDRVQSGNLSPNWPLEDNNASNDLAVVNRYEGNLFSPEDFDLGTGARPYGWGTVPGWGC
jgi:phage gp36-like protein